MADYRDMTVWGLEQERDKIMAEIARRMALAQRAAELELHFSPHRIHSAAVDGGAKREGQDV